MQHNGSQWRRFAREATDALRARIERLTTLRADERERLVRRFEAALGHALEVPPDLQPRIEETAAALIASSSEVDPVALAWARTRERARRTAAIGAITTVPAMVPGIGTALAALGLVADWRYVAEQQRDLVLEIAALFGDWPENPTEDARNLFLAATATAFASPEAGRFVSEVLARQIARRGVARLLPGAGAAVAGGLNYIATVTLGRVAISYFGERAGVAVHGVVPVESHPALPSLRNAVVEAIENHKLTGLFSEDAAAAMKELRADEREELLDVAAALLAAADRLKGGESLLKRLGLQLGFTAEQVETVMQHAQRDAEPLRKRLGGAIQRVASKGGAAAESVWRYAARIARPRKKKSTGKPPVKRSRAATPKRPGSRRAKS